MHEIVPWISGAVQNFQEREHFSHKPNIFLLNTSVPPSTQRSTSLFSPNPIAVAETEVECQLLRRATAKSDCCCRNQSRVPQPNLIAIAKPNSSLNCRVLPQPNPIAVAESEVECQSPSRATAE